jgi:GxxExxY protein
MNTDNGLAEGERDPLTRRIIGAAFEVARTLGHGFLEKIYQNALVCELKMAGLIVDREVPFRITYKGNDVGAYLADIIVERSVVIELKAFDGQIIAAHIGQCLNYLRASGIHKGLVINFGRPRLEWKRVVL